MKNVKISVIGVVLLVPMLMALTFVMQQTSVIYWGFDNIVRAKEWVSPDGRISTQSQLSNMSTAYDCWPTSGTRPMIDSLCELTLNRYQWDSTRMERFSISAMADEIDGGAFRFGVERGKDGQFRPMIFCFEAVTSTTAHCPLKIDERGVYALKNGAYYPLAVVE